MPTIFEPKDLPVTEMNDVNITTLANRAMLGTNALQVERIILEASAKSATFEAVDAERFLYVIRGKGQAFVSEQAFPLDAESMLWLEKDEPFYLEADTDGLEVLLCHAPGNE
jgi:redox-sensitive bicupin YhaK (pirin superfamily)